MDASHPCLDWRDGSLSYAVSSDPHVRSSVPSLQSACTFVRFCAFFTWQVCFLHRRCLSRDGPPGLFTLAPALINAFWESTLYLHDYSSSLQSIFLSPEPVKCGSEKVATKAISGTVLIAYWRHCQPWYSSPVAALHTTE